MIDKIRKKTTIKTKTKTRESKNLKMDLSIVIPVYNERESVEHLYSNLNRALSKLKLKVEVILIDDGSTDGTYGELKKIHKKNNLYKIIRFRRNFGQTSAMSAGFDHASGDIIVTLDADLQNDQIGRAHV